jgi:predicted HicB family RNase H-like nuclease
MGKTSSKVKDRYNAKAYDEIKLRVPKGEKDIIKAHADKVGESVNGYIKKAVDERMERESTE